MSRPHSDNRTLPSMQSSRGVSCEQSGNSTIEFSFWSVLTVWQLILFSCGLTPTFWKVMELAEATTAGELGLVQLEMDKSEELGKQRVAGPV